MEVTEKRTVIYARYSCEKQTEQSIEGQLRVCHEFAERNGYVIVHEYIDRAVSGKTDKREQFQQMLKDSAKQEFNYVLVYKLDRFARNRYDSAINKATLKKNGVKVLSACEQITDSPEGIILESLIEGMAEYYSAELSQKVKRGMRESYLKGNAAGLTPIFGYRVVDKKYQVIPEEAEIVRKIYADYVNGTTIKEIETWLGESGIRNHRGRPISNQTIAATLRNKKYIGKFEYGGEMYDNIIMPIVDELTFYRAQELLAENAHKSGRVRAGERFILSGKIICSHCEALYNGESGTCRNGDIHYFYKCRRKKEGKDKCCSHAVPKQLFEDSVYKTVMTALKDEAFLRKVAEQAVEIHNKQIVDKPELKILKRQLAETEEMLNNITTAICKGIYNEHTQTKMSELTLLKTQLVAKIAEEEANSIKPLQVEMLMDFFHKSILAIECAEDPKNLDKRKKLFDAVIKEIIFDGEKYLIVLKTSHMPDYSTTDEQKEKSRTECDEFHTRFETLRFGEPKVNYPNTVFLVGDGFGFVIQNE